MAQPETRESGNCKVISIVWYKVLPAKYGGQKAVSQFNNGVAEHLILICLCSKDNIAGADEEYEVVNTLPVSKLQFLNPVIWWKICRFAKLNQVTHVLLEFPYHGIAGVLCKKILKTKLIVSTHNVEFLRFKELRKKGWRLLYLFEGWVLRHADLVFFKTAGDSESAKVHFNLDEKKLSVVRYGTDEKSLISKNAATDSIRHRHKISKDEFLLLFAGTLDYEPNAQAVRLIAERIIPMLLARNFRFKVVVTGRNVFPAYQYLQQYASTNLLLAGDVADVESYFLAADVFINPVLQGGGIQTKIIDALSYHLNVVCFASKAKPITHAGAKIFAVSDGNYVSFADSIILAASARAQTPDDFLATYNWRTIAEKAAGKICSL